MLVLLMLALQPHKLQIHQVYPVIMAYLTPLPLITTRGWAHYGPPIIPPSFPNRYPPQQAITVSYQLSMEPL
ncbi:Hypothetical predicted protein [Pelobates cultripes]|uniref:Uncharacterized protein n=1 Tax=Pelobates cultripes TaxID=61616 RepID=A0AAD1SBP9_PELCU|nr:Hypothetical predicted protein [Pelobates cultripes]